jgi:ectoine hydroxylase-related dioxygenase (phytanoyl-CoA dioxygenase family)
LLTDTQITEFSTNGVVLIKSVFLPYVEQARVAIEENQARPSWRERTYRPDDGSAPFFQDYCVWSQFDGYRALVRDSPMAELAAMLMGSSTARIFHDHVLVKEPGNSVVTPWHQDKPYYLVSGEQTVSFWVPLDPIPRDRTIEYIAGSHKAGKLYKPQRFDGTDLYEQDDSEPVPDIDIDRSAFNILGWAVEPGDAVAFDFGTLHGAPANSSTERRRVISFRWVGDDARFVARPGKTSPAFPDLHYADGDKFEGAEFPVIFP